MKKKTVLFAALLTGTMLLSGCGTKKESIIIYSPMEEYRNQDLKQDIEKKFPDYDIKINAISTGNTAAKIANEGTSTEADIIIDLETAHAENLKDNFASLADFDSSIYMDGVNKSDKYLAWVKYTMNLIIDKDYFTEHNLKYPKTYEDLLKKEYKGIIAMPDPKVSGTGYAFYLNAVNIMGQDKAIEYFKKLKDNLREFSASGSGPVNLLKQKEIAIAMGMTAQGVDAINNGYNFEIVELKTGSPYNTTSAAIIKGKETRDSVKEVFKYLINDWGVHDKEVYMPDKILKVQNVNIPNYPKDLTSADMTGIDSVDVKTKLIEKWDEIDG